jgi:hypothetical protein
MSHILVVANETVAGRGLIEALEQRARESGVELITVICPISQPSEGYVVYEDTRRASAGRRLDRTLEVLHRDGIAAHGMVVDAEPVDAVRDALAQLEPPATEIIVSTHPQQRSGWLRRDMVERIRKVAGELPVEHVVVDLETERETANVLVIANETIVGKPLLDRIRERAERSSATFLLISPQSDSSSHPELHPEAERRLRRALAELRGAGVEAHGQIAHPDPYTAAMHAVRDERIDEIIISTFPGQQTSSWLRRDVVDRVRKATGLPVEHVVVEPAAVGAG